MKVILSKKADKQLKRCPDYIQTKFEYWVDLLQTVGLRKSRRYKGFHDEPLFGKRRGQRSVRLSKAYRVLYRESANEYKAIEVLEVNKHGY